MKMLLRPATALSLAIAFSFLGCGSSPGAGSPAPTATAPSPPSAKHVEARINTKGLRADREVEYAKPKGRMRIVCIGGAVTFGEGVSDGATYEAWMQKNMRGRGYDVEVLNAGKPGFGAAEAAAQLGSKLIEYQPDLVVVSIQSGEGTTGATDLERIQATLQEKKIVYILLAVPDYPGFEGYVPKPPAVYLVPSKAALGVFAEKYPLVDTRGRWTEFAHEKMGNALAELIVGAPLLCCATGPLPQNP